MTGFAESMSFEELEKTLDSLEGKLASLRRWNEIITQPARLAQAEAYGNFYEVLQEYRTRSTATIAQQAERIRLLENSCKGLQQDLALYKSYFESEKAAQKHK